MTITRLILSNYYVVLIYLFEEYGDDFFLENYKIYRGLKIFKCQFSTL